MEGKYLGNDGAESDDVQIITQENWDKNKDVNKDGTESIDHEAGSENSSNITETEISDDAIVNIVEHYNSNLDSESTVDGVSIVAKELPKGIMMQSKTGGGYGIFGIRFGESKEIRVNVIDGKVDRDLNTASNIKNTLVHENHHLKNKGSGIRSSKERSALDAQRGHSTWERTTDNYKQRVSDYEKLYKDR